MNTKTLHGLLARREIASGLFLLGVVLIPAGFVIFNAGRTVMKCSPEATGSFGIEAIYGAMLIVTDGCNLYEVPFFSIFGAVLAVLILGYVVAQRVQ